MGTREPESHAAATAGLRPYGWMLLGSLSFAVMGALTHALRDDCPWQGIALARAGLVLAFALGLARAAGVRLVLWRPGILWVRSLAGSASLVCTFFALTRLPVSDVLTLTNMFPLWVALLAWPVLGERPSARVGLAAVCGVAGVALIEQFHLAEGNFACLVALAASFSTAVAMLGLNRLRHLDARAVVVHFSLVGTLVCLSALLASGGAASAYEAPGGWVAGMLLAVGVTATAGQLFLTRAFATGPPARVAVVSLTQVVFALPLDVLFLGKALDPLKLLGIALVLAPTAWVLRDRGSGLRDQ